MPGPRTCFAGLLAALLLGCSGSPAEPEQPLTLEEAAPSLANAVASAIAGALEGTVSLAAVTTPETPLARLLSLFSPKPAYANSAQSSFTRNCPISGTVRLAGIATAASGYTLSGSTATFTNCGFNPGRRIGRINGSLVVSGRWCPGQGMCNGQSVTNPAMPAGISGNLDVSDIGSVSFGGFIGRDAYTIPIGGVGIQSGTPDILPPPSPNTCPATLSPASVSAVASGGASSLAVTVGSTCPWTAVSGSGFLAVTAGANGRGNGTVSFTIAANTGAARTGTLNIAGQNFTVNQAGTPLNVTGTWTVTHSGSASHNSSQMATLTQSGNSISGQVPGLATANVTVLTNQLTGTITGTTGTATLTIALLVTVPNGSATTTSVFRYTLTAISNSLMSGTFTVTTTSVATVIGQGTITNNLNDAGSVTLSR